MKYFRHSSIKSRQITKESIRHVAEEIKTWKMSFPSFQHFPAQKLATILHLARISLPPIILTSHITMLYYFCNYIFLLYVELCPSLFPVTECEILEARQTPTNAYRKTAKYFIFLISVLYSDSFCYIVPWVTVNIGCVFVGFFSGGFNCMDFRLRRKLDCEHFLN